VAVDECGCSKSDRHFVVSLVCLSVDGFTRPGEVLLSFEIQVLTSNPLWSTDEKNKEETNLLLSTRSWSQALLKKLRTIDIPFKKELIMRKILILLILTLLFTYTIAVAAETVENPKNCQQCGMDRVVYARSRMLILYADGTSAGVCSLHCAAEEMKKNKGKQVTSLKVADYTSRELIDAKTAVWVIGGKIPGVMSTKATWAFAGEEGALNFIKENGGAKASFEEAVTAAAGEAGAQAGHGNGHHGHSGHDMSHMGLGAQMLYNPAFGDDIYHTHPAGMWMFNYKYMHMNMDGLRSGTSNVDQSDVGFKRNKPYNYMMIPTNMTMDMHMLMAMVGITDRLTAMAMGGYVVNKMNMLMDMGPGKMITNEPTMSTEGFGDTELRGIYKINKYLCASLGLSLPTGDINKTVTMMKQQFRAPYDMQLGSGTFDLKPALTYNTLSDDAKWNWGAQAAYTYHIGKNVNDYSLGNILKVTSWLQRAFGPATSWVRLAYSDTGRISGSDQEIDKLNHPIMGMGAPTPDADPGNYGGQRADAMIGVSYTLGPVSIGLEGGLPFYQYVNGLQLKTTWFLTGGLQVMF
jgi:nitrous oxide reductase accessory protein NosL